MNEQNSQITRRTLVAGAAASATVAAIRATRAEEETSRKEPPMLRVAQIGMQGHFGDIVRGIPEIDNCELVAVARSFPDEEIEDLERFPAWKDEVRIFDDAVKMLDTVKPDVVSVFTPYAHNGRFNIEAARRGCHIMSEKPLTGTLDELERLRAERDRNRCRVTAVLGMRLNPAMTAAHLAVQRGEIGEPLLVSAQKSYKWGDNRPWYFKQREDYGGSIPWVAIHAIDFIRYISGLEYADVTARQAVKVHKDYPECEDCGALLFEMTNGGQCTLTFDYFRPKTARSHGDDRIRVVGSKGIVEVRLNRETFCELITQDAEAKPLPLPDSHKNVFIDFVNELRGKGRHYLSPEDPFRATEVALKARAAADTKKTVKL